MNDYDRETIIDGFKTTAAAFEKLRVQTEATQRRLDEVVRQLEMAHDRLERLEAGR